mmetsp:Transcript_173983/g.423226  ORF Transcript_173983/g.423226 Transcript_173983/m.423226 type:complete len:82 (-) Transcript_173983:216-461(-)
MVAAIAAAFANAVAVATAAAAVTGAAGTTAEAVVESWESFHGHIRGKRVGGVLPLQHPLLTLCLFFVVFLLAMRPPRRILM